MTEKLYHPHQKLGAGLAFGIFIAPYIFSWFLLKKDSNYSPTAKFFSFIWMAFVLLFINALQTLSRPEAKAANVAKIEQVVAAPVAAALPLEPQKPTCVIDPKLKGVLSGAWPEDARACLEAQTAWEQHLCTDATLKADKQALINRAVRQYETQLRSHTMITKSKNPHQMVLAGLEFVDATRDRDANKYKITASECFAKRGKYDASALDFDTILTLRRLMYKQMSEVLKNQNDVSELQLLKKYGDNLTYRMLAAKSEIDRLKREK